MDQPWVRRSVAWLAGLLALGSGIALLSTILFDVSLALALVFAAVVVAVGYALILGRSSDASRGRIGRTAGAGLVAGLIATLAYDATKALLSQADPSPFNPFEAVRVFGVLLVGEDSSPELQYLVGTGFHLLNGVAFGVAYAQFFGGIAQRSAVAALLSGMAWGLFLELFQLTLYPGWLSVRFVSEFQTISFAAHLVYGATLGMGVRTLLRRRGIPPRAPTGSAGGTGESG